jgi:hypothetical protein
VIHRKCKNRIAELDAQVETLSKRLVQEEEKCRQLSGILNNIESLVGPEDNRFSEILLEHPQFLVGAIDFPKIKIVLVVRGITRVRGPYLVKFKRDLSKVTKDFFLNPEVGVEQTRDGHSIVLIATKYKGTFECIASVIESVLESHHHKRGYEVLKQSRTEKILHYTVRLSSY